MSTQTLNLTPELYQYYHQVSLREPQVLQKLRSETAQFPAGVMQISPEQGQFMAMLVKLMRAKKTLDIGTFTGYSALSVALALPADGKVIACDVSKKWTDIAKSFWKEAGVDGKIELRIGPALETLDALITQEAGTFDFIFIDADKRNYSEYYERALSLLKPGGVVAIDNVLWDGKVIEVSDMAPETVAIRALNDKLKNDTRVMLSMLPISDGLTLALKLE